jgi:hypothetical protein
MVKVLCLFWDSRESWKVKICDLNLSFGFFDINIIILHKKKFKNSYINFKKFLKLKNPEKVSFKNENFILRLFLINPPQKF